MTTAEVIQAALEAGWEWMQVGSGLKPVLTNRCIGAKVQVTYVLCTYCERLICLHGHGLGQYGRWGTAYCDIGCKEQAQKQRQRKPAGVVT